MATWKELLEEEMRHNGEALSDLVEITLTDEEMVVEFDAGRGSIEGKPFTAWTATSVYFPVCYDGSEWVESVSRHPDGKPTFHLGGG